MNVNDDRTFVDIWILTTGLPNSKIGQLREATTASQEKPVCCYEYVDGGQFFVKDLITGFARIIVRKTNLGVQSI